MNVSPLGILATLMFIEVSIEAVENQSKRAAYALVIVVLLSIVVFNAQTFNQQMRMIIGMINARPAKPNATSTPTPLGKK